MDHGERAWSAPHSLDELIAAPDTIKAYGVRFSFSLLDIGQMPDESLATNSFLQCMLQLLKYGLRPLLSEQLEQILLMLLDVEATPFRKELLDAIVIYIMAASPTIPLETLSMAIQNVFPPQIERGSIADKLLQEGRQEGRQEGEIRLLQTLQGILGISESDVSSLNSYSLEQLRAMTTELRNQIQKRLF